MIEISHLSKSFKGVDVLKDVSANFYPSKLNFIIGRSGQGKSVLTKCMIGLLEPEVGSIVYDGKDLMQMTSDDRRQLRQDMGVLFQGSALFDSMTVEENVMFPLTMFSNLTRKEKLMRVDQALERVNLTGRNQLFPAELSGGMKKRTGIARAIIMNPKYLFVDEPNSGLDPATSIVIDNLIKEITYDLGTITIVVSHDMNSVFEISDHIHFVHQGKMEWQGNKLELLQTKNEAINDFVFPSNYMKEVKENLKEFYKLH